MNREILEYDVYQWLLSLNVLTQNQNVKILSQNKYELDENTSRQLVNGVKFGQVLKQLLNFTHNQEVKLQQYKDTSFKEERLQNWYLNEKYLKLYGLPLSDEQKKEFYRGDHQKSNILLKNLLQFSLEQLQKIIDAKKKNHQQQIESQQLYEDDIQNRSANPKNLFDFIMFSLKAQLNLQTHEQVIALLAEKNKFLSKIIILGIKQEYQLIINWFQEISDSLETIIEYLKEDNSNLTLFLDLLKHSLISKESKICHLGLQIFQKLIQFCPQFQPLFQDWFIENNMLQMSLSCMQKYSSIQKQMLTFLPQIGDKVLFSINISDKYEYLSTINLIFEAFSQNYRSFLSMHKTNYVTNLLNQAIQQLEGDLQENNLRLHTMTLLSNIWQYHYEKLQQTQQTQIFNLLKKCIRSKSTILQIHGIYCTVKLLDHFATEKSQNAPYIYKTLVFFLIEMHDDLFFRQTLLSNFTILFQKYPQMPIQLMLNPLIKQIQEGKDKTYFINTFDIDFFKSVIDHPELTVMSAINIYDFFLQIYMTDIRWSFSILDIFVLIEHYFQKDEQFLQKLYSIVLDILLILYNQEKNKMKREINEKNTIDKQKRNLLLIFIKKIAEQNLEINIIPKIVKYYHSLQNLKKVSQQNIFKKVLSFFGDPEALIFMAQKPEQLDKFDKNESIKNQAFQNQEQLSDITIQSAQYDLQKKQYNNKNNSNDISQEKQLKLPKIRSSQTYDKQQIVNKDDKYFMNKNKSFIQNIQQFQKEKGQKSTFVQYIKSAKGQKSSLIIGDIKSERENRHMLKEAKLRQHDQISPTSQTKNKVIKENQNKMINKLLPLQDWDYLLPIDLETQNLVLQKYQPYIKHLYNRYSSSKSQPDGIQGISFEQIHLVTKKVHSGEIYRLLKDLDWAKYVQKEIFQKFIQFINKKLSGNTIMTYDHNQFQEVLMYLSVFMISNEPFCQAYLPIGKQLDLMLQQLYRNLIEHDLQQQQFKDLFQNDIIIIKKKTQKSEYILQSENNLPKSLTDQIQNKNYLDCYEIISSILKNSLNLSLTEKLFNIQENQKPLTPKKQTFYRSYKLITEKSANILGRQQNFKLGQFNNTKSKSIQIKKNTEESFDLENMNKFAKQRLQIQSAQIQKTKEKNIQFAKNQEKLKLFVKQNEGQIKNSIKNHENQKNLIYQQQLLKKKQVFEDYSQELQNRKPKVIKFVTERKERQIKEKEEKIQKEIDEKDQRKLKQKEFHVKVDPFKEIQKQRVQKKKDEIIQKQEQDKEEKRLKQQDYNEYIEKQQENLEKFQKKKEDNLKKQDSDKLEKKKQKQELQKQEILKFQKNSEKKKRKLEEHLKKKQDEQNQKLEQK